MGQNEVGQAFDGALTRSGAYIIRVYQLGSAATSNKATKYELTVELTGQPSGGASGGSSDYSVNKLSNGGLELVWQDGCIGTFNRQREPLSFNDRCTDPIIARSREIAKTIR